MARNKIIIGVIIAVALWFLFGLIGQFVQGNPFLRWIFADGFDTAILRIIFIGVLVYFFVYKT